MAGQAQFMVELRKAAQTGMAAGKKPADLAKVQLPEGVKNWVGDGLGAQVKDAYEEITQGKPHGEILGGK
jgi:hypothetical protein